MPALAAPPAGRPVRAENPRVADRVLRALWVSAEGSLPPRQPPRQSLNLVLLGPLHKIGESWVSIWSRFPIERIAKSSDPSRSLAVRIVPDKDRPILVYGTVLP